MTCPPRVRRTRYEVNPVTGACKSGNAGCVPLDIFHGIGAFTPDMLGYIYINGQQADNIQKTGRPTGTVTGDLGQYGVKYAVGPRAASALPSVQNTAADYIQRNHQRRRPARRSDGSGGVASVQPRAGYNATEGFGEVQDPR